MNGSETTGFNRTFMELKWAYYVLRSPYMGVLIVPLWNWNYFKTLDWYVYYGFNRTFMELKFRKGVLMRKCSAF